MTAAEASPWLGGTYVRLAVSAEEVSGRGASRSIHCVPAGCGGGGSNGSLGAAGAALGDAGGLLMIRAYACYVPSTKRRPPTSATPRNA